MTDRLLVTGASGFLGRAVLRELTQTAYEVHVVHRAAPSPASAGVRAHRADLLDAGSAERLVERVEPTHLMHLAWCTTPGRYWTAPENRVWVAASLRLLDAFARVGGRRVVAAGTCAERAPEPTPPYAAAKREAGMRASAHAREAGYSLAWARIFHPYGPYEAEERLVPSVMRGLLAGRPVDLTDGRQLSDFMFVDDVASALVALLGSELEGPVDIGSGEAVPVRRMVELIGDRLGRPDLLRFGRLDGNGRGSFGAADTMRLRDELGWSPSVSLEEGVESTARWWRDRDRGTSAG